jgi:hypothetical protein
LKKKKNIDWAFWLSRVVRWGFGGFLIWLGMHNDHEWAVIIFGAVLVITGFFRPRRCINDSCDMQSMVQKK